MAAAKRKFRDTGECSASSYLGIDFPSLAA